MEKFLRDKRPREESAVPADQWRKPKKIAIPKDITKDILPQRSDLSNRFSDLPVDDTTTESYSNATKRKPINQVPPILIELLGDWSHLNIKNVIEKHEKGFHLQFKGRTRVKVQCYTPNGHQRVKDGLLKENVAFHTFSRKDEKLPKAVIKGLPRFTQDTLPAELAIIGFAGATITELKTLHPTECPPLLVHLPSGTDMAKFKQIKYLFNCVIEIQRYKPGNKAGTQCFRCQDFGHASKNCNRPARCVKCAQNHPTWQCPKKDRDTPARCCNCLQDHPANYTKCSERLQYIKRIQSKRDSLRRPLENHPLMTSKPTWTQITSSNSRRPYSPRLREANKQDTVTERNPPEQQNLEYKGNNAYARNRTEVTGDNHSMDNPQTHDSATAEMLEILSTIKSLKTEFGKCNTFMDKVILILTHLGRYV